mgnify:CR=1 FL=1
MYDTILVPIDGSDPANRAVEHALTHAREYDSVLHAMYVVETNRYGEPALSSTELVIEELEEYGQNLIERLMDRADNEGITVEGICRHGTPHEEILKYADEIDADLIIIGYQGHSHDIEGHVGSTTDSVIRNSTRPVLTA